MLSIILLSMFAPIHSDTYEYIFKFDEIQWLEDTSGAMSFTDVKRADGFQPNVRYYPKNEHPRSVYWFRVRIRVDDPIEKHQSLIEFYDQTIDDLTVYLPQAGGGYEMVHAGAGQPFGKRLFRHKNFEFLLPEWPRGTYDCYVRVRSLNEVNFIMVYRTVQRFINYALVEYITYGLFYGMILVFCLYNLLMLMATRLRQYLYYVLYIVSVGIYEMSTDGIAFQYIWPDSPAMNEYMYGISLYCMSVFALIFACTLLGVKQRAPLLYTVICLLIVVRTVFFLLCLCVRREWFIFKFLDFIPLFVAFLAGFIIWCRGFKPARFFVLGNALLFIGAIVKLMAVLGYVKGGGSVVAHYSMVFGFVMEMILLSFSIGDQVRLLRKERKAAEDEAMYHMQHHLALQASVNQQLEEQVAVRTRQLEVQAEEIARMNKLLEKDNAALKTNIEKITDARITSAILTFEEFSQKYPDQETCYAFLAELKWSKGFGCKRCGYTNYSQGRKPFSRRCNRCAYEESPMHDTIFENNRIPINKAFYIVYLVFTTKGSISSYQLAEKTDMRQGTCWAYATRVKGVLEGMKKGKRVNWTDLIVKV